ncbi:hypothetical protein Ddye_014148 [Dipteronia dyeriana]|uniref:Uncharacterized protein n=1 Tax=Dipteronia dyeriana TaxID=168575 RepID=A0AAD9X7M9_9ROSI|nr:hypothetical protein Ddye_014148 [Dipteronia dyeriana]
MLFIIRGNLTVETINGERVADQTIHIYGKELLTYDPPISNRTVKVQSAVEAFALEADDLKSLAAQFNLTPLHNNEVRHINGGSSEGENKSQDDGIVTMNSDGSLTSLGATTYTTKFTASGNGALQRTNTRRARIPDDVVPSEIPDDQKPVEPDLTAKEE